MTTSTPQTQSNSQRQSGNQRDPQPPAWPRLLELVRHIQQRGFPALSSLNKHHPPVNMAVRKSKGPTR